MGYLVAQLEHCYNQNSFSKFTSEDIRGNSRVRASENPILHKSNENSGKLAKSLQQSRKHLLKKSVCILIRTASMVMFLLAPFSSPLYHLCDSLGNQEPQSHGETPAALQPLEGTEWC